MSALSTPGGGGTTAQSKPTYGKQKYQKLDINSLYCANRNESSEPSSVKSQLSRKHGMQSLGKVPSARRPPANLPSLKTETGQDLNANSVCTVTTTATTQATCISQTVTTASSSSAVAGAGWSAIPPPSSPHFRTEFPSLEAAVQPSHRSTDHTQPQPQLRPQTEGSWTCGGTAGVRQETTSSTGVAPASTPASQQTPAFRAILPPFLMKGSSGTGLGLGTLSSLRDNRNSGGGSNNANNSNMAGQRQSQRPSATPRTVEVLTTRPILREDQISSLDDISRDAGWAQHDDIDYDQKLDFSDGETSTPTVKVNNKNNNNRTSIDNERLDPKMQDPGDEDQLWAERRQKQSNEVAQAVARARQRKEEEQRRQMRDSPASQQSSKDNREKTERNDWDRNDREREYDHIEKQRAESKEKERSDNKYRDRNDLRDRDKDRLDNRDRDRLIDNKDRGRQDNRDRNDSNKERDLRDRDRNENRDRNETRERNDNRMERERFEKERDRGDRDRDRDRADRERADRDRDFRERDFARERDRDQLNSFSKTFQANIPPRFLKQQHNRQQEDQHKGWAFAGKSASRRQEPPSYNPPRHTPNNGRRSYSRDYSDREDEVRRDKDGPQWRSEMQDYDRSDRELDRSNSKDSYKEFNDYKDRRSDFERKPLDTIEQSSRTAADKLTEVFERKSIGVGEQFTLIESSTQPQALEKRASPPTNSSLRELMEKDLIETSWADVTQEEQNSLCALNPSDKNVAPKLFEKNTNESVATQNVEPTKTIQDTTDSNSISSNISQANSNNYNHISNPQYLNNASTFSIQNQQTNMNAAENMQTCTIMSVQSQTPTITDSHFISKCPTNQVLPKSVNSSDILSNSSQAIKQFIPEQANITINVAKQIISLKAEKDQSELILCKASTDLSGTIGSKIIDSSSIENIQNCQKQSLHDKKGEQYANEQGIPIPPKEPIERKSSGSGSEKKGRGYCVGGYNVYGSGWGSRESRGRRSHKSSRSNNRASESDGSTDGTNIRCKERCRAARSPRVPKKQEKPDDLSHAIDQGSHFTDGLENREPFAPRGQPSRRGRGGFHGTSRPPAPAKRVTGYGPPNTKSPFSQANRANKDNDDCKDNIQGDIDKNTNKPRSGSSASKGRDRRSKGGLSGEDENWETTSEHSESGGIEGHSHSGGRQLTQSQKGQSSNHNHNFSNRQNNVRNQQGVKKEGENKGTDAIESMGKLKLTTVKKDEEAIDDGFREVRNKKNLKDIRGPLNVKEEKQPRSRSNQSGGRNGSSSRNSKDKSSSRGSAPVPGKLSAPYDNRPRQANLAPRFVKQRQKKQMGLVSNFGSHKEAAPPPPPVNAWDKPISHTLRRDVGDPPEAVEIKSNQSSQHSTSGDTPLDNNKAAPAECAIVADKTVFDGTTPPVGTIIFENTNYKTAPPAEALKQKYQPSAVTAKPQGEDGQAESDSRSLPFNGDVRSRPRSIQELMAETGRPVSETEGSLGLQMAFETSQKTEDSSDMKLDFDLDLGQLTDDKSAKALSLPPGTHMSTSNTISPLAADLNLKIASVKKVWEMHAVAEGSEELQFTPTFEENNTETGAPPNVCKVKPTQQLQSPPPQHYNHVAYQGGYGGLSVPSPPAVLYNSTQQLLGSSQQLQQQGGLYGAFLDQTRGQFGGFPGTPYGAGSATPYNYQPPPDMFQSLPSQYRMAAAVGGGAAFGRSGQLGNSPSTVLISSTSNSLMSATVKPSTQQIGAIGSKGGGVGGVGGISGVNTFQQQYLGYSGPVGESPYSLPGLLPRPAPPSTSYYSPYQPPTAPAPNYPLQFTPPAQSSAFSSQFLSSQLHVAAAVQQMQQQYRAPPLQQQYAPPQPRPPPQQQLKSPLHEHANGFAQLCDSASPTPKGASKPQKPPHSPPQHKYHAPPPQHQQHPSHPPPAHTPHQHHQQHQQHQQQMIGGGNNGRGGNGGNGGAMNRGGMVAPRYPAPIQRPHAPAPPVYRAQPQAPRPHHAPRPNLYYHHHQRNGGGGPERVTEGGEVASNVEEVGESVPSVEAPASAEVKAE